MQKESLQEIVKGENQKETAIRCIWNSEDEEDNEDSKSSEITSKSDSESENEEDYKIPELDVSTINLNDFIIS